MYPFIEDLDEYFCASYAKRSVVLRLPGYVVPKEGIRGGESGAPLPENMRLSHQPRKAELLRTFKQTYRDSNFSFSFVPLPIRSRGAFRKRLVLFLKRYQWDPEEFGARYPFGKAIWHGVLKGKYLPSKYAIFGIAIGAGMTVNECVELLEAAGESFSNEEVADIVTLYLLSYRISNPAMARAAFAEYGISGISLPD